MVIESSSGQLKGYYENGLFLFKGIPYAKAERFKPPKEYRWNGVLDCTKVSKIAPQIEKGKINLDNVTEDCLTLNIYTPDLKGNLPVLIEIHGGAFQTGSNQKMDPYKVICSNDFIYININYRLGVLGYLYIDEYPTSGNNGTLDQLAALKWIKNNIHLFGGNPNKITLLGSSAGAKAIGALMVHPESQFLFSQAIMISGAYQSVRSLNTAKKVTQKYYNILNIHHSKELINMDLKTLLEAQNILCQGSSTCMFGPVADEEVIPKDYYLRFHQGQFWKGNVLMSSSLNELVFYEMMDHHFIEHAPQICEELFGIKSNIAIEEAKRLNQIMPLDKAYTKVLSDGMYRTYTYKMAKTLSHHNNKVYLYGLHLSPACHVLDHLLALCPVEKYQAFFKTDEQLNRAIELGSTIQQAYINFVKTGNPKINGWNELNKDGKMMIFDKENYLKPFDLNDVCTCFEDEVYVLS